MREYILGTLCKGMKRNVHVSASRDVSPSCAGLYDFVMSHYADLVYMMRYENVDMSCLM